MPAERFLKKPFFHTYLAAISCLLSLQALAVVGVQAAQDTISQTIIFNTTPTAQWWIIPAMEVAAIILYVVINTAYWNSTNETSYKCQTKVVSLGWIIAGLLMTQFGNNPLFAALNIVGFTTLFIFVRSGEKEPTRQGKKKAFEQGILAAIMLPVALLALHLADVRILTPIIDVIASPIFQSMYASLAFGIFLVPSVALINKNLVGQAASSLVGDIVEEIGYIPDEPFETVNEQAKIVAVSAAIGFVINVGFKAIFLGETLYILPGISAGSLMSSVSSDAAASFVIALLLIGLAKLSSSDI